MQAVESDIIKQKWPRVVIIGAGFGGLAAAKALADKPVRVTVLDRTNHHLFQPLLYQVATSALSPANIAQPIRSILHASKNTEIFMTDVTGIDTDRKQVITKDGEYRYDYLVVATGARHSYFGNPQWEKAAPGLKTLEDALDIRRRLLEAFEKAEKTKDPVEREKLLTFVVVGAGPTGVEMAGAISEIAKESMPADFRHIDSRGAKVILLDAAPRVLPVFHESLSESAKDQLEELGVDVRLGVAVQGVSDEGVQTPEGLIAAKTVIWAAGNAASPLVKDLKGTYDRAGRIEVTENLNLPHLKNVFVIGDTAHCKAPDGKPLPGVSPVAMQQGKHVAKNVMASIQGGELTAFGYWDRGSMATIGRHRAIADVHFMRFSGYPAWLSWVFIHLMFLMSMRNRISVFLIWVWSYFTRHMGARLITHHKNDDGRTT